MNNELQEQTEALVQECVERVQNLMIQDNANLSLTTLYLAKRFAKENITKLESSIDPEMVKLARKLAKGIKLTVDIQWVGASPIQLINKKEGIEYGSTTEFSGSNTTEEEGVRSTPVKDGRRSS